MLLRAPHHFAKSPRPKMAQQLCWLRLLGGCCVRNEQQPMAQDASPKAQAATGGSRCFAEAQAATDGSRCLAEAQAAADGSAEAQKASVFEAPLHSTHPFRDASRLQASKVRKAPLCMSVAIQRHRRLQNSLKGGSIGRRWLQRFHALAPKGDGGSKGLRIGCTRRRWLQRATLAPN